MNLLSDNGSRLRRFIAGRLSTTSTITAATCLIIACLAVLMVFLSFACNGPMPAETPLTHVRSTPIPSSTDTPSPTIPPTSSPTPFPPVTLTGPENGAEFDWGSEITLRWSYPDGLQPEEYYRLRVQPKGQRSFLFYHDEDHFALPDLSPGEYEWAVAVVRSVGEGMYVLVSEESDWRSFTAAPPKPVVHSIWPESTVRGRSVPVVVSGENLTRSLTIVIGAPLQTTFVDAGTLTATIPMTLATGRYPVILQDATGASISSVPSTVSFTVKAFPPPPTPPHLYPPIELQGIDVIAGNVTFKWNWPRTLAADEWFDVRVGIREPHSVAWTKDERCTFSLTEAGEYTWEIAVCRGDPAAAHCSSLDGTELVVSKREVFRAGGISPTPILP